MDASGEPEGGDRRQAGPCPLCNHWEVVHVVECRDVEGRRVCDLYQCRSCRKFFPWEVAEVFGGEAAEDEGGPERRAGDDRRTHSRFRVQFVLEVHFEGTRDRSPRVATVLDASYGGICFLYPEAIPVGRQGRIRLSLPSGFVPFDADARVIRCTPTPEGSHVIAVEFVRVDPRHQDTLNRYTKAARPA